MTIFSSHEMDRMSSVSFVSVLEKVKNIFAANIKHNKFFESRIFTSIFIC